MPETNIKEIKDMQDRKTATISGRITQVGTPKQITLKDGSKHNIQECMLQDGSGEVVFNAWDTEVNTLNVGDNIRVENGWTTSFKNELRFQTGKFGKLVRV